MTSTKGYLNNNNRLSIVLLNCVDLNRKIVVNMSQVHVCTCSSTHGPMGSVESTIMDNNHCQYD